MGPRGFVWGQHRIPGSLRELVSLVRTRWPAIISVFYHSETRNQFNAVLPFLHGAELALFHTG